MLTKYWACKLKERKANGKHVLHALKNKSSEIRQTQEEGRPDKKNNDESHYQPVTIQNPEFNQHQPMKTDLAPPHTRYRPRLPMWGLRFSTQYNMQIKKKRQTDNMY